MYEIVTRCRICGSRDLIEVLDLGAQPLANHFRLPSNPGPEPVPLKLCHCQSCKTAQITATVRPEELFRNYLWVTGTSIAARSYSETFVDRIARVLAGLNRLTETRPRFVVEIASNDGTFLRRFQERGWRVLGVEPVDTIAESAVGSGVPTIAAFFDAKVAEHLFENHGPADVVVAKHFVHVAEIHSVIEGLATLAGERGIVVIEVHSAEVILQDLHYDSIYHEHLFYFSLETLSGLCHMHGLYPFEVFQSPTSGGSLTVYLSRQRHLSSGRLEKAVDREHRLGTNGCRRWLAFAEAAVEHATTLKRVVGRHSVDRNVIGYGASARSSTMLNFARITSSEVAAVIDQNDLKHGRLTPGTDIPIVSPEVGMQELGPADSVLLSAWNFEDEIVAQLRSSGFRGDIIVPLPREVRVI